MKPTEIPFSMMRDISDSGMFVKRFGAHVNVPMKDYAHRDDYFILALMTAGKASVNVDFAKKELRAGEILILSPWQVHSKPSGDGGGWMLAFSPEGLRDAEARTLEEYSISPCSLALPENAVKDLDALCSMLERNGGDLCLATALVAAVVRLVLLSLECSAGCVSGRCREITLRLKRLLDRHMTEEKRPSEYASMLNISEVYLNEAVKGATGLSAGDYIRRRVMVQAMRQMSYTASSSKEIAFSLGYMDYAYFSRLFKKVTGKSPMEYRKNLK